MQNIALPLLASVALLAFFDDNEIVFIFSALAGSGAGILGFIAFLKRPRTVRFTNVMAVSLLLGYALGTVFYAAGSLISSADLDMTYSPFGLSYSQSDLSIALIFVYIACAMLFFLSRLEKPIFNTEPVFNSQALPRARLLIWIGAVMVCVAFAMGDLGYMGVQTTDSMNITALGSMSFLLAPTLLSMSALCAMEETARWRRTLLMLAFGLFLIVLVPLGRRVLLYSLLVLLLAYALSGRKLTGFFSTKSIQSWFAGGGLVLVGYIGFQLFYALRLSVENLGLEAGLGELLRSAFGILQHEFGDVTAEAAVNTIERPFILAYLAAFVSAQSAYPPLWGDEFVYAIKVAIPSLLFPQKVTLLPGAPEEFIHPAFGFYVFDGPNSIVTAGLNDLGLIGILIYPLLLVSVYVAIRRFMRGRLPTFIFYFVMLRLIYQLLYIEQALAGMLTVGLRDLAIAMAACYFIWNFPTLKPFRSINDARR